MTQTAPWCGEERRLFGCHLSVLERMLKANQFWWDDLMIPSVLIFSTLGATVTSVVSQGELHPLQLLDCLKSWVSATHLWIITVQSKNFYFIFCQVFPRTSCHQNSAITPTFIRKWECVLKKSISCIQEWRPDPNLQFPVKEPDKYLRETDGTTGMDCIEFSSSMKLRALCST